LIARQKVDEEVFRDAGRELMPVRNTAQQFPQSGSTYTGLHGRKGDAAHQTSTQLILRVVLTPATTNPSERPSHLPAHRVNFTGDRRIDSSDTWTLFDFVGLAILLMAIRLLDLTRFIFTCEYIYYPTTSQTGKRVNIKFMFHNRCSTSLNRPESAEGPSADDKQ
jgi:hypothetical protein